MSFQSGDVYKHIMATRIEFKAMGVKHVYVINADDPRTCDYCRMMHHSIIPLDTMTQHVEHCKNEHGCCCQFEPSFEND